MRSAAIPNLLIRYGAPVRPLAPLSARIAAPRWGGISYSSAFASRRSFHASSRALWSSDKTNASSSSAAADDEEIDEQEQQRKNEQSEIEAAFEEKEKSDAYKRWVEAIRMELKNIEELVCGSTKPQSSEKLDHLEEMFLASPAMAGEAKQERIITFEGEPRRPDQMPYRMLDPKWYQDTTEDERVQQVLEWRPFNTRSVAAGKADQQFAEDPFRNKSMAFSGRIVTENFRRKRLEKYIVEELANKRKVYSNVEEEEVTNLNDVKQSFRANLKMVELVSGDMATEEVTEPEVSRSDKYTKPAGFVSATDMLKFGEEKLQSDLEKLRKKAKKCVFCRPAAQRPVLDPMNVPLLAMFMTATGDIIGRRHNGNCRRHQRKLAATIKRAKHMKIFSYKYGGFTIYSPFHAPPVLDIEEADYGDGGEEAEYTAGSDDDYAEDEVEDDVTKY